MAARLTDTLWDIGDIVKLIEEWEENGSGTRDISGEAAASERV
jgi:hypothetical protein